MKPNELKALIDLKFHGVDNFQAKILKDKNILNKPKRTELNAIIKTGQPVHLFEQLVRMAKYYGKHTSITRTLPFALCDTIRTEVIKQYGTFENFYLTHDIERSFLDRLVNKRLVKMSPRVQNVCEILGIKY
jgi:hypothetical protein